jgi:universal stress protein F
MYSNILVPVALDHEALIPKKLDLARRLLSEGGRITVLTVLESLPGYVAEYVTVKSENHLTDLVRGKLDAAIGGAQDVTTEVRTGKAGMEIVAYAQSHGCDLIIVASHRPGLQDYFLGSTAARVSRRAPCSVMVVRDAG